MRVVIRTDASILIGSGHVMRCLTLADALKEQGADVSFICREHPGNLNDLISAKGYLVKRLPAPVCAYATRPEDVAHAQWLAVSWEEDAVDTIASLGADDPELLIIDHYALERRWEQKLRRHCDSIVVIDDLADRQHDCDLLLDQNLYQHMETRYASLVPKNCQQLLGPSYALLRPEFLWARKRLRDRDGCVKRVLVFFGGVDATNETAKVLTVLSGYPDRKFAVDVVVGGGNVHKESIKLFCQAQEGFEYHCQVDNMAELMAKADLAVGAGGTATWERCAVGLPAIVVSVADNQQELSLAGAGRGLFLYMGAAADVSAEAIRETVRVLNYVPATLESLTRNCLATVDAKGSHRVARLLCPPQIILRVAAWTDCDDIHKWRNAEETRRYIFDREPIPLEQHRAWFRRTLDSPDRIMLIGEMDGSPIGVLRYDFDTNEALISIYLVPGGGGRGLGVELIRCGSRWIKKNRPAIKVINAEVLCANAASMLAFERAGYVKDHVTFKEVL